MTHDPVEELLGVYALDAVDDDERAMVDAHLAECPRCRSEVDGYREVAAQLALSGAPAPSGLWDRIAETIDGDPAPPLRLVVDDGRREQRPRWVAAGRALAAAAAVLAVVGLSLASIRQQDTINDMEQAQDLADVATTAFASPDARIAELATAGGEVLVRAAVLPDGNGYLLADALPDLPQGTYQLWGATGDQVISLGAIGAAPTVRSFPAGTDVTQLMVTAEAVPVAAPTTDPLVAGYLS